MVRNDITAMLNKYRKDKNQIAKSALEAVLASLLLKEKSGNGVLTDNDVLESVSKEIKVQKEIAQLYQEKSPETTQQAIGKIEILEQLLPKQMTEVEVLALIKEKDVFEDASPKTKGMIIKSIMPLLVGKFDKSKVNPLVEKYLAEKQ